MDNQNKLKVAVAAAAVAALVAAVAVPTVLSLRDDEVITPNAIIDPDAQARFAAAGLDVDLEAQGMIEPLFSAGDPVTVFDDEVTVIPDGSASIRNSEVEPIPVPGELPVGSSLNAGIAAGEPHPPTQDPTIEGPKASHSGASGGSMGPAVGPVVVNASDVLEAPTPEPGVVRVVPIGTFTEDVQID